MNKRGIALLSLGHLACDINAGALPALFPFIQAAYGLSYQSMGGLMFAFSCVAFVVQPPIGWLADRYTWPWLIPLGILLSGCGLAAVGFSSSYTLIFTAIVVSGIGSALFHPEGACFTSKIADNHKGTALSLFAVGGHSGFAAGPIVATAGVALWGMQGTGVFAAFSVIMASLLLWQVMQVKGIAVSAPAPAQARRQAGAQGTQTRNNWREFGKLTMVVICRSIVFLGLNAFIPLYWIGHFKQSQTAGALVLTALSVCGIVSNLVGGILADRYGYHRIMRVGSAILPSVLLVFALTNNVYVAYALLPFLGFSLYVIYSPMVVLGQQLLPQNMGFASGVTLGLATGMGGVTAPVLGLIADTYGLPAIVQCLAAVTLAGAFFAFWMRPAAVQRTL